MRKLARQEKFIGENMAKDARNGLIRAGHDLQDRDFPPLRRRPELAKRGCVKS
jgi:hypothetical protein